MASDRLRPGDHAIRVRIPKLAIRFDHRIDQPEEMDVPEFDTGHNVLRSLLYLKQLEKIFPARTSVQ